MSFTKRNPRSKLDRANFSTLTKTTAAALLMLSVAPASQAIETGLPGVEIFGIIDAGFLYQSKTDQGGSKTSMETSGLRQSVTGAKQEEVASISGLSLGLSEITLVNPPGKKGDGYLAAFEPITGKVKWKLRFDLPPMSSVLTTGGGLVFTGDMRGNLFAFDADNGKELWTFAAGSGARGGPVSYSVNGKQYITIPTGLPALKSGDCWHLRRCGECHVLKRDWQ